MPWAALSVKVKATHGSRIDTLVDEVVDDPPGQCLSLASPGTSDDSYMPFAAKDCSALIWRQGLGVD